MDISSSAVVKRRLVEPVKLDATINRSTGQTSSTTPVIDCSANLDFVKVKIVHRQLPCQPSNEPVFVM